MSSLQIPTTQPVQINYGNSPSNLLCQNTGSNTIYISDQQNCTADSTSIAIPAGTPFTWPKDDPLYAICAIGAPSTLAWVTNNAEIGTSLAAFLTPTAQYINAVAANTLYRSTYSLPAGLYTITIIPNTASVNFDLYDSNGNLIISTKSTSGQQLILNIATNVAQIDYWSDTANTTIEILKSGTNLPYASGVLTTITATGSVGVSGDAYVILVGGGGGSSFLASGSTGGIVAGRLTLTGNEIVTIGAAGSPGNNTTDGTAGGATTLKTLTALGGNPATHTGIAGVAVAGGAPGSTTTGVASQSAATISGWTFASMGTTGSGGGSSGSAGAGNGIGTGGTGSSSTGSRGGNATGYGASGGATQLTLLAGNSTPGVCYIII